MTGILDEYPGAAAAYSLRLLNTDYTGDAVIVRRASDNATTNIGFVDGDLDTAALDTFCTGTDGFVATWFDQSGNENNAVQTVAVEQPKVYDAVSGVILSNGKPSLYFDGTDNQIISNNLAGKARLDAYFVANTSDTSYLYPVGSLSSYGFFAGLSSFNTGINQGYGSPELYVNKLVFTGTTRNDVYDFLNITTDKIPLRPGWNLISTDVAPADSSVSSIFSALIPNNLEYATGFDNGASFYDPNGLPFLNTLNSFERGFGYWIKVGQDDTLCIEGDRLSETFRKGLDANWNLLAYPPQIEQSPDNYFSDIIADNNLLYVTGFDGISTFFDPAGLPFLNTLTVLENGLGYWVKVNTPVPGQGITGVLVERENNSFSNKYNFVGGKTNLPRGEIISILKESGDPLGQIEVLHGGILRTIPIYLPEEDTAQGTKILFQHTRGTLDLGLQVYGDYEPLNVNLEFKEPNETSSSIHRCYPNPFDQSLTIDYSISERGRVKLEICDVAGKLVWQKEEGTLDPGFYQEMLQTENFLSGSYLVKLYIDQQLIQATKVTAHK